MSQVNEHHRGIPKNDQNLTEILILDFLSSHAKNYNYIVTYQKEIFEATIPLTTLKKFGRNNLNFGTVLLGNISIDLKSKKIEVRSVKLIYLLSKAQNNKWTQLKLEYCQISKKQAIYCSALTSGCFTYLEKEFTSPAIFNDILGIIEDSDIRPLLPKRQIGRLICLVTTVQCPIDGSWKLQISSIKSFEKVLSLAMSAKVGENEHFGLVTREECEEKRDLRLVSSRDFPRDVRIFRSGSHCCESIESGHRRPHDHHSKCINTCVGEVNLIGKCMAFRMKRCHGMAAPQPTHLDTTLVVPPNDLLKPSERHHVDFGSMRGDVTQLDVHVQSGFVEVETIAEYSGFTDHNGQPLLWSYDVEFVVDISKIFHEQNLAVGLYLIKVVRFHRPNVFAKWRLARRNPILRSMQTRFHAQGHHSISLSTLDVRALSLEAPPTELVEEPRKRLQSFSRFGNSAQSCCLPRTDSLDKVELFDALVMNENLSEVAAAAGKTTATMPLTTAKFNMKTTKTKCKKVAEVDEDEMWQHINTSTLKIVDDDVEEVLPKTSTVEEEIDENSNVF